MTKNEETARAKLPSVPPSPFPNIPSGGTSGIQFGNIPANSTGKNNTAVGITNLKSNTGDQTNISLRPQ